MIKKCVICQKELQGRHGLARICSSLCRKELDKINQQRYRDKPDKKRMKKEWTTRDYQKNKEKKRIYNQEYRQKNREEYLNWMREYHKREDIIIKEKEYRASPENKKKRKLANVEYKIKNRDEINERNRLWRQKPEVKEKNQRYAKIYQQKPECKNQKRIYRIKNREKINLHNRFLRQKPENKQRAKDFQKKYSAGEITTPKILYLEKSLPLIKRLYLKKDYDASSIAKKLNTSNAVILAVLRRNNIPIKPKIFCNKRVIKCSNGLLVKSNSERMIAEILLQKNISFEYEPRLDNIRFIPDFYIPEKDLYVEYAGLTDKEWYNKQLEKKKETYKELNINAIFITKPEQIIEVLAYQKV